MVKIANFFSELLAAQSFPGGRPWAEQTRGKSGGQDFGNAPRGYRHEFGSLREFIDEHHRPARKFSISQCTSSPSTMVVDARIFQKAALIPTANRGRMKSTPNPSADSLGFNASMAGGIWLGLKTSFAAPTRWPVRKQDAVGGAK